MEGGEKIGAGACQARLLCETMPVRVWDRTAGPAAETLTGDLRAILRGQRSRQENARPRHRAVSRES